LPTYDYRCNSCGHTFELRQTFAADPITSCPKCQQEVRRLFHAPAIIYKGSGFYTTDYKRSSANSSDYSKEGSADGSASKESSKSEESTKGTTAKSDGDAKQELVKESAPSEA